MNSFNTKNQLTLQYHNSDLVIPITSMFQQTEVQPVALFSNTEATGTPSTFQDNFSNTCYDSKIESYEIDFRFLEDLSFPQSNSDLDEVVSECLKDLPIGDFVEKEEKIEALVPQKFYKQRKDVVYKGFLRRCRKHYQTAFLRTTQHVKYRKSKKIRVRSMKDNLNSFVAEEHNSPSKNLPFFLGSFIYPNEIKRIFKFEEQMETDQRDFQEANALVNEIHQVLYKFTLKKMEYFCSYPELAYLLLDYINKDENSGINDPKISDQIEEIKTRCEETLKGSSSSVEQILL